MEIRQLQYFVAIYEEQSVSRAAQRLNAVQPALSQQLSKLEDEIGHQLFVRTPKGMVPTDAGREAYELFQTVLKDIEYAKQALEERKGIISGHVSIGVVSSVANNALSETLRTFSAKYPLVRIRATGGYSSELTEMLRTSEVDVIVVNVAPNVNAPNMTDILTENLALICDSGNSHRFDQPLNLKRIAQLDLVIPSRRHGIRTIIDQAALARGVVMKPSFEFDELATIEAFIRGTDFFTILPPIAVHRAISEGQLRHHPIRPSIPRRLVCMTNANRALPHAAELLIAELGDRMTLAKEALQTAIIKPVRKRRNRKT